MSLKQFWNKIERVKQKETQISLLFFTIGIVIGYFFTLMFEPFLKFVLYRHLSDAIYVSGVLMLFAVVVLFIYSWRSDLPLERSLKLFFLGVSAISFFFALYSFIKYPDLIFAGGRPWITYGKDYAFPLGGSYAVRLSDMIYFIAKILWSTFVGSLFAVLDRFWRLK